MVVTTDLGNLLSRQDFNSEFSRNSNNDLLLLISRNLLDKFTLIVNSRRTLTALYEYQFALVITVPAKRTLKIREL